MTARQSWVAGMRRLEIRQVWTMERGRSQVRGETWSRTNTMSEKRLAPLVEHRPQETLPKRGGETWVGF